MTTGRYAPSPTGSLHIGNLRTAVLAWCFARSAGGRLLLRIEDTNTQTAPEYEAEQLADLEALGIHHDGDAVRQSERGGLYDHAIAQLKDRGLTYPCFCSRREIREAAAAPHGPGTEGAYPGTCGELSASELQARLESGREPALRLRAEGAQVAVRDAILGEIGTVVDDFVLRRADGVAAYNLAVVVDDAAQQVDQVVRGDDLAFTTSRQVLLQQLLGLDTPQYVHVPLVVGSDGQRMSKRHGSVTLADLRALGFEPATVRGWIAESLGLAEPGETPAMHTLLERFDPNAVPRDPWTFVPPSEPDVASR